MDHPPGIPFQPGRGSKPQRSAGKDRGTEAGSCLADHPPDGVVADPGAAGSQNPAGPLVFEKRAESQNQGSQLPAADLPAVRRKKGFHKHLLGTAGIHTVKFIGGHPQTGIFPPQGKRLDSAVISGVERSTDLVAAGTGRGMGKRPGENMNLRGGFPHGTDRLQRTGKAAEIQKFFGKEKMILLNSWKNEHILGSTCEKQTGSAVLHDWRFWRKFRRLTVPGKAHRINTAWCRERLYPKRQTNYSKNRQACPGIPPGEGMYREFPRREKTEESFTIFYSL